jgi:magnesium-transporting ATPase (P-type)
VRRLNAIENFGSMDILGTNKTGTLTESVVRLDQGEKLNEIPYGLERSYQFVTEPSRRRR